MLRELGLALHRALLRTQRGPLRPLWSAAYGAVAHGVAAILRFGARGSTAYLRGSLGYGDVVYGVSDIDLSIVVPAGSRAGVRARRRWAALCRLAPPLGALVQPAVYEDAELREVVSAPTLLASRAVHLDPRPAPDEAFLRVRPGAFGPLWDWRRLAGRGGLPEPPAQDPDRRRIAAWLELQRWWREAFRACAHPGGPRQAYLCAKLVAEPARIWLWLEHGERVLAREEVLDHASRLLPEEADTFGRALALRRSLASRRRAPLERFLPDFVRLSARLARVILAGVEPAGTTAVRLVGAGDPLVLPAGAEERLRALLDREPALLPLADWRGRTWPEGPDEAIVPADLDAADPAALGTAAQAAGDHGPFPALRADGLLVLPGPGLLRAIQCPATDPVSFALLEGRDTAPFPNVPGWSAADSARRAVDEHAAWLGARPAAARGALAKWMDGQARSTVATVETVGRLLTAARAGLFSETLDAGEPELAVTLAAVARRLGERRPGARALVAEAYEAYRSGRRTAHPPPAVVVTALRQLVVGLPAYRFGPADP